MPAKLGLLVGSVGLVGLGGLVVWFVGHDAASRSFSRTEAARLHVAEGADDAAGTVPGATSFRIPSGDPSALSCAEAQALIREARSRLAYVAPPVVPSALTSSTADWLDPHGLWSASPDSPVPSALDHRATALVRELEGESACTAARAVGEVLATWIGELSLRFRASRQRARETASSTGPPDPSPAADPVLDSEEPRPARSLADTLGARVGAAEQDLGEGARRYGDAAERRFFPPLDADGWSKVVLAAAVRAYVPLIDPHGAWAALDEEASVSDVDLAAHPPDRLWDKASRTALGVLVESDPLEPLEVGDAVLALAGVPMAGLPPEQIEQLAYAVTDAPAPASLVVLRRGEHALRTLELPPPPESGPEMASPGLPAYRVRYGLTDVLVVEIHDVRTDLAEELAGTVSRAEAQSPQAISGLLLDLRDDGGGSTEGAIATLGMFLPGAQLFPMIRRDGSIEVDRAPLPPSSERWTRAVATLVDGDTASAAEMIAGGLAAYHRGPVVGTRTYGKGCAQEYLDDEAGGGVLRLTTLLYALPDGSPVQGVGLEPSFLLPVFDSAGFSSPQAGAPEVQQEREADIPHAPPTWRGPDVRDPTLVRAWGAADGMAWAEPTGGPVGPCPDAQVCQALRTLGSPAKRPTAVKKR